MSPQLPDLYPPIVLEHGRRPSNRRVPVGATHHASGENPLCGDHLCVHLHVEGERIRDIGFEGVCCVVATASASLMTRAVVGRDLEQARRLGADFSRLMSGSDPATVPDLGELVPLAAIGSADARAQCAALAWQALSGALRAAAGGAQDARPTPDCSRPAA